MSSSLQEKEATVALLEGKLPSCQKAASTPQQLSDVITLTAEIAELKQSLKEAELFRSSNLLWRRRLQFKIWRPRWRLKCNFTDILVRDLEKLQNLFMDSLRVPIYT